VAHSSGISEFGNFQRESPGFLDRRRVQDDFGDNSRKYPPISDLRRWLALTRRCLFVGARVVLSASKIERKKRERERERERGRSFHIGDSRDSRLFIRVL